MMLFLLLNKTANNKLITLLCQFDSGYGYSCMVKNNSIVCVGGPALSTSISTADLVGSGFSHSCYISTGSVFCWGLGNNGQLGNGSLDTVNVPTQVVGLNQGSTQIAGGSAHTCAISKNKVYCWGSNGSGQIDPAKISTNPKFLIPEEVNLN